MNIEDFTLEMIDAINQFKNWWKIQNEKNPEAFPLEFENENSGIWLEQFLIFYQE